MEHGYRVFYRPGALETVTMPTPADADEVLGAVMRRPPEVIAGYGDRGTDACRRVAAIRPGSRAPAARMGRGRARSERAAWRSEQMRRIDEDVQQLQYSEADPLAEQMARRGAWPRRCSGGEPAAVAAPAMAAKMVPAAAG